jgi:hypothetical protein
MELSSNQTALILSIDAGQQVGESVSVPVGQSRTIGRTTSADLATHDGFMSGVHFEISNFGEFAEIRDLRSTNKTWVNDSSVATARVNIGDRIRAGKTFFSIQWERQVAREPKIEPIEKVVPTIDAIVSEPDESQRSSPLGSSVSMEHRELPEVAPTPSVLPTTPAIKRSISPFDSVDSAFPYASGVSEEREIPTQPLSVTTPRAFASPFDDELSSASHSNEGAMLNQGSCERHTEDEAISASAFHKLVQCCTHAKKHDLWDIFSKIAEGEQLVVVAHFRRIGEVTASELCGIPVGPNAPEALEYFPVMVEKEKWRDPIWKDITRRLAETDAIMLMVVKQNVDASTSLRALTTKAAPGFSMPNGLLTWFWPSCFYAMCESLPAPAIDALMDEAVEAVVCSVPQLQQRLFSLASTRMRSRLSAMGFEPG